MISASVDDSEIECCRLPGLALGLGSAFVWTRARLAMIASQLGFRLGLASPKRKGTRRRHCLRSSIATAPPPCAAQRKKKIAKAC